MPQALTIGLTGGIASGKSFASTLFIALGVPLLEADDVARAVVAPGTEGLAAIVARFGASVLLGDGSLNRRALREVVFNDADARRELEAITHPRIRSEVAAWRARQTTPYCVYAAAILIESGFDQSVDRVLVIDVPEPIQKRRLQTRDGISAELAEQMIKVQTSRQRRLGRADDVLDNRDETRSLQAQVARLNQYYTRLGRTARRI